MDARPTEPFRREHAALLAHIEHIRLAAREMPRLSPEERRAVVARVLDFLDGTLLPHARAEEEVLYPEWARLVGSPEAAAPMVHDHRAIVARAERLGSTPADDADGLQELLYGLHALICVHFDKEEQLQLPVFDRQRPAVVEGVLARMAEHAGPEHRH
jgi:iron-sulfur cluster repair protein YtfE (RIC family)